MQKPKHTPFEFVALLLLELPLLFTFMKLVVLDDIGDRSHQFDAERAHQNIAQNLYSRLRKFAILPERRHPFAVCCLFPAGSCTSVCLISSAPSEE